MAQTKEGGIKLAASHYGLNVSDYIQKIQLENYCNKCKLWKSKSLFCKDNSRATGLHKKCNDCRWVNGGVRVSPFKKGQPSTFKGKKHKPESIEIFKAKNKGHNNPNWKGGITNLIMQVRNLAEFKEWRKSVYYNGNFICSDCGIKKRGNNIILDADHIYPLSKLLFENGIKSAAEALLIPEIWDVSNGRCLCRECHKKTETWGKNINKKVK